MKKGRLTKQFRNKQVQIKSEMCLQYNKYNSQSIQISMSFIDKLKSVFKSKASSYKFYSAGELKVLAMKTRIQLQEHYKKCIQIIQAEDSILFQRKDIPADCYRIMQQIGKYVIQTQSIRIYAEILKKIQAAAPAIIKTNGDIALLKTQLNWFQCLLWYRKYSLYDFCYNFFKGVDITCQINPKCQIFKLYPIMLYLNPDGVVPIKKIYPQIKQYLKTPLDETILAQIFKLNSQQIKNWFMKQKIQFKQRYISHSKSPSPIKKTKSTTPLKKKESGLKQVGPNDGQRIFKDPVNDRYPQTKQSASQIKPTTSFMRKVMQSSNSSKVQQNRDKKVCLQCGTQINPSSISDNSNISQSPLPSSQSQICPNCSKNKHTCKECGVISQPNRKKRQAFQSFGSPSPSRLCQQCHKQIADKSDIKNSEQQICSSCHDKQKIQQIGKGNICEECQKSTANQVNKQQNKAFQQDSSKNQAKNQEQNIPQQKAEDHEQHKKTAIQQFQDEQESLRFIRQSLVQKKKPLKKPYMVSIYARAQYVANPGLK